MHLSLSLDRDALIIIVVVMVLMLIYIAITASSMASLALLASFTAILILFKKFQPQKSNDSDPFKSRVVSKRENLLQRSGTNEMLRLGEDFRDDIEIPITNITYEPTSAELCDRSGYFDRAMDRGELAGEYETHNKDVSALVGEKNPTDAYPWSSDQGYTDCYPGPTRELNGCNLNDYMGIDESNTRQVAMRTRDKKVIDGYITKNANYYKRHFSKELEESENKRWWGNDEY